MEPSKPSSDESKQYFDLQVQENELRLLEINANSKISEQTLQAQLEYEKLRQEAFITAHSNQTKIGAYCIAAIFTFSITALFLDKASTVTELVSLGAALLGAGYGSYHYGKSHRDDSLN